MLSSVMTTVAGSGAAAPSAAGGRRPAVMACAFLMIQRFYAVRAAVLGSSSRRQAEMKSCAVTVLPSDQRASRR